MRRNFLGLAGLHCLPAQAKRKQRKPSPKRFTDKGIDMWCCRAVFLGVAAVIMACGSLANAAGLSAADAAAKVNGLLPREVHSTPDAKASVCDDETFLRRVSLDLIGKPPTPAQITAFVLDPAANKRARLVEDLLARPEYGHNWARYWRDVILYRRSEDRALLAAAGLESFLTEEINRGAGWNEIATQFITATGDVLENGRTGLIMAQMGETEEITAEVSRIFMGVQIQCAQCHNHPTDRWKRQQFHELAAFFPRIAVRPKRDSTPRSFEVVSVNFQPRVGGPAGMRRGSLEHYMSDLQDASAKGTLMSPKFFVNGRAAPTGLADLERRALAAQWITSTSNPWFAKAFVNRMWGELVGEGFYEPIDDLGPDRHCSAPETMQFLATEFTRHNHDMRWLLATIVSTDVYQSASRSRRNLEETPFAANCPQRLRADQIYDSLTRALGIDESQMPFAGRRQGGGGGYLAARGPRGQFNQTFGFDPSNPRDELTGSIPQALFLMNNPLVTTALDGRRGNTVLGKLLAEIKDDETLVAELYLRCLAREPKAAEIRTCLEHLKETNSRGEAFEDILWALVNSTEFLHRK